MKFIKDHLFGIAIALLFLIIAIVLLKTCNDTEKIIESKTTIKKDTIYLPSPIITIPEYSVVKDTIYLDTTRIPKPSTELAELTKQYKELANKHYSDIHYKDSVKLTDSAYLGKELGTVYIDDLVTENELKTRNIRYQLKYPVITNNITTTNTVIKEVKSKKTQYSVGPMLLTDGKSITIGAGLNIKKGIFSVSLGYTLINSTK